MMLERPTPLFVRRTVSFGNAIFTGGSFELENMQSVLVSDFSAIEPVLANGQIPILIDPDGKSIQKVMPSVVIDARLQKDRLDTQITDAPLVIALGPGFEAGRDCHAVIETQRGHTLGRVIWQGSTLPDTGTPGRVEGYGKERVLRAVEDGFITPAPNVEIGSKLQQGDLIAMNNQQPIYAPFPGVLRGLIHPTVEVWKDLKIGDLDPRGEISHCYTVSDKSLAIGGGVLEAVMSAPVVRKLIFNGITHATP